MRGLVSFRAVPEKGFASVTLPRAVVDKIRAHVQDPETGWGSIADFLVAASDYRLMIDELLAKAERPESPRELTRLYRILEMVDSKVPEPELSREKWEAAYGIVTEALLSFSAPRCPNDRGALDNVATKKLPVWKCPRCGWQGSVHQSLTLQWATETKSAYRGFLQEMARRGEFPKDAIEEEVERFARLVTERASRLPKETPEPTRKKTGTQKSVDTH